MLYMTMHSPANRHGGFHGNSFGVLETTPASSPLASPVITCSSLKMSPPMMQSSGVPPTLPVSGVAARRVPAEPGSSPIFDLLTQQSSGGSMSSTSYQAGTSNANIAVSSRTYGSPTSAWVNTAA